MTSEELRIGAEKNQGARRVGDEINSTNAQAQLDCAGAWLGVHECGCLCMCVCIYSGWLGIFG
jgi:hypothetical protein